MIFCYWPMASENVNSSESDVENEFVNASGEDGSVGEWTMENGTKLMGEAAAEEDGIVQVHALNFHHSHRSPHRHDELYDSVRKS